MRRSFFAPFASPLGGPSSGVEPDFPSSPLWGPFRLTQAEGLFSCFHQYLVYSACRLFGSKKPLAITLMRGFFRSASSFLPVVRCLSHPKSRFICPPDAPMIFFLFPPPPLPENCLHLIIFPANCTPESSMSPLEFAFFL